MDPENALTAIKPEETSCGSAPLAESAAGETAGRFEEIEVIEVIEVIEYGSH